MKELKEKSIQLKCKKLYLGDPCYALSDSDYNNICCGAEINVVPGLGICCPNGYGDIEMADNNGRCFSFDSGQFAVLNIYRCNLEPPKNASDFSKAFYENLNENIIEVLSGSATVIMSHDGEGIQVVIMDDESDKIIYSSYITPEINDDNGDED